MHRKGCNCRVQIGPNQGDQGEKPPRIKQQGAGGPWEQGDNWREVVRLTWDFSWCHQEEKSPSPAGALSRSSLTAGIRTPPGTFFPVQFFRHLYFGGVRTRSKVQHPCHAPHPCLWLLCTVRALLPSQTHFPSSAAGFGVFSPPLFIFNNLSVHLSASSFPPQSSIMGL